MWERREDLSPEGHGQNGIHLIQEATGAEGNGAGRPKLQFSL